MKKPNILFAIADDASHFGAYGHSFVKTPCIDNIAKNGVVFNNAFTSNPKCAPSRATILTGKFTWELEEGCNHYGLFPDKVEVYPDIMEKNGYHVGFTGKGWCPGDYTHYGRKRNPSGNEYNNRKLTPPKESHISDCDYKENFRDFLNEKEPEQAFCFWYGGHEPHRSYSYGEGLRAGKTRQEINKIPTYFPDTDEVRIDMLDYAYEIEWFDKQLDEIVKILKDSGEFENTLIIVTSDNGCPFPRVKGQMYEQDFHLPMVACMENTIAKKRKIDDIISFTDLAPTILDFCGIEVPKEMTGRSFKDALLSPSSGEVDYTRDITYFGREKHDLGRENDLGYPVRCVRTKQYLYIFNFDAEKYPAGNPQTGYTNCDSSPTKEKVLELYAKGESFYYNLAFGKRPQEELYDIVSDSECLKNLASLEEYAQIKGELKDNLFEFLTKTNDPRLTKDKDYFEKFDYAGEDNHSWKALLEGRWSKQKF